MEKRTRLKDIIGTWDTFNNLEGGGSVMDYYSETKAPNIGILSFDEFGATKVRCGEQLKKVNGQQLNGNDPILRFANYLLENKALPSNVRSYLGEPDDMGDDDELEEE